MQFPHRYASEQDKEIAAFIAACFAYGSVQLVHRAVAAVLLPMGERPSYFIKNYDGKNFWPGFYHRFHHEEHVVLLIRVLKKALDQYGSLSELFRLNSEVSESDQKPHCERVLDGAARWLQFTAMYEAQSAQKSELVRGMRFFFNAPADGSACKRMLMFLRWMVRKDEIDLGLWGWIKPSELVVPTDTHVARISYYLGLRGGREQQAPNWKMALEITQSLRQINASDPVLYDFAIARLGILDICKRKYLNSICEKCPVEPGCRFSNLVNNKRGLE